jgi:xylulokinase
VDPPAVLGIDLGTSQVKALLCAPDGTALGQGTAGYQVSTPVQGWAETDPEDWWHATRAAVRSAAGPARAEVAALAAVGQMHGLVLSSERAGVLRPGILWLDRRASAETDDYRRLPAHLLDRLGNAPSAGMAGPILLWLSRHEPDAYARARWMLQPKDWLRLTGEAGTDPTDASGTLLFDAGRGGWATDVAGALGLRTDLLPAIRPSAEIAGNLLPGPAEQLGLRPGLPVAAGAADTAASLLAARLPDRSWGLLTLGTGGQLIVPAGQARADPGGTTNLFRSVDGGSYRLAGAQNVGVTLDWVRRTLGASWDELYGTAERPWPADVQGVEGFQGVPVFLPYLAGERWDDDGTGGAWTGLRLAHRRDDLMRAALEGVAFLLRGKLDDMRAAGCAPAKIQLAGGGSQHPAWRRLLADALALPLYPSGARWLTARGAARIAATAAGMLPGAVETARSDKTAEAVVGTGTLAETSYRRFRSASRQSRS